MFQRIVRILLVGLIITTSMGINVASALQSNFNTDVYPWLQEQGFTSTKSPSEFRRADNITRAEAARFLSQYSQLLDMPIVNDACQFSDMVGYTPGLATAVIEVCQFGFFRGVNGQFIPNGTLTEQQAMVMILRSIYGNQDESGSPWYRSYFEVARDMGFITDETMSSIFTTPITREKMGTWMYLAIMSEEENDTHQDDEDEYSDDEYGYVYETEVDGPDDCTSYEEYDNETSTCYFECDTEDECEDIMAQVDEELEGWGEDLEESDWRDGEERQEEDTIESSEPVARYSVKSGEKITFLSGDNDPKYQDLWAEIAELSPDTLSNTYIETFEVYDEPSSDSLAFVHDEDGNGKWVVAINIATHGESTLQEQKATFIHELAHIITLNTSQVGAQSDSCKNYEAIEGCTKANSYMNMFVKQFWGSDTSKEYDEDEFVTEYAPSAPEEDIAESFAFFVLESDFTDSNIRNKKVNFFNSYPELKEIRTAMRSVLAQDVVRSRKEG